MSARPASEFWDYSLAVYDRPGVQGACLGLQDRLGLNVNLLLYCCWRAYAGHGAVDTAELSAASTAIEAWHSEVVEPLRRMRRRVKEADDVSGFYRQLLATELEAERVEQERLDREPAPAPRADPRRLREAAAGLSRYLELVDARPQEADVAALADLLAAAFDVKEGVTPVLRECGISAGADGHRL